jgi:hypothetical protein
MNRSDKSRAERARLHAVASHLCALSPSEKGNPLGETCRPRTATGTRYEDPPWDRVCLSCVSGPRHTIRSEMYPFIRGDHEMPVRGQANGVRTTVQDCSVFCADDEVDPSETPLRRRPRRLRGQPKLVDLLHRANQMACHCIATRLRGSYKAQEPYLYMSSTVDRTERELTYCNSLEHS